MNFQKIVVALMLALMLTVPSLSRAQETDRYGRPIVPRGAIHDNGAYITSDSDNSSDADEAESDKADAVVARHAKEIKKIPHVEDVDTDEKENGETMITVTVDKKENVDGVTRQVPSKIEGFAVDVIAEENDGPGAVLNSGELKAAEPTPTATP
jgi:hypothetical protein